jgi:hypothetical protein
LVRATTGTELDGALESDDARKPEDETGGLPLAESDFDPEQIVQTVVMIVEVVVPVVIWYVPAELIVEV